jgi:hypothetical protein
MGNRAGKELTMTPTHEIQTCDRCHETLDDEEVALGWPVPMLTDEYVCPQCFGDAAFCCDCGRLLPGDIDTSRCDDCDED